MTHYSCYVNKTGLSTMTSIGNWLRSAMFQAHSYKYG